MSSIIVQATNSIADLSNNTYEYVNFDDNEGNLIDIGMNLGSRASAYEYRFKFLTSQKLWGTASFIDCMNNAKTINSRFIYKENKFIQEKIKQSPNVAIRSVSNSTKPHYLKDMQFFDKSEFKMDSTNILDNYTIPGKTSVEIFGYFKANSTDEYKFISGLSDALSLSSLEGSGSFYTLWITNDHALYDYTLPNSQPAISNISPNSYSASFTQNNIYSFRIHMCNNTPNDIKGSIIQSQNKNNNSDSPFLLLIDGNSSIYYKKLLYFAFVYDAELSEPTGTNQKFECYFIDSSRYIINGGTKLNSDLIAYQKTVYTDLIDKSKNKNEQDNFKKKTFKQFPYKDSKKNTTTIINYTLDSKDPTQSSQHQYYYLYRINSFDLFGQTFLAKTCDKSSTNCSNSIKPVPNTNDKIMKVNGFEPIDKNNFQFPAFSDDYYSTIQNQNKGTVTSSSNFTIANSTYNFNSTSNYTQCETACANDPNCGHYFFMDTKNGTKCVMDSSRVSTPLYNTNNPSNINVPSSKLFKKKYQIHSTCSGPDCIDAKELLSSSKDARTYYHAYPVTSTIHKNEPYNTYSFADDIRDIAYNNISQDLNGTNSMQENFESSISSCTQIGAGKQCYKDNITVIQNQLNNLNESQNTIGNNYTKTTNMISNNTALKNTLKTDIRYSNSDNNSIPSTFTTKIYPKTSTSDDGRYNDIDKMIEFQNYIYIIGIIAATTLLIGGMVLAREQ